MNPVVAIDRQLPWSARKSVWHRKLGYLRNRGKSSEIAKQILTGRNSWKKGQIASEGFPCYPAGMLFCTIQYVLFLATVFAAYWSISSDRARVWLLLSASIVFYASWNKWLAALIGITTVMDYLVARGIESAASRRRQKMLLGLSLLVNLSVLIAFKYANFFLDSLRDLTQQLGVEASLPVLSVILPVGISFYTFEAINYTVDVYRGRIKAERDLGCFMLFILFFPHLVAGPIVRAKHFLPQIKRPKRWSWPRMSLGVWLIVLGVFKKLAIADRMGLFADPVFNDPGAYSTGAVWMAAVAFAVQIYCDFSGYSDIAIGSAHLLGFKLAVNFRMPYLSTNIAEFWRGWHISLSSWLRDYVFIPLGGSRGSRWKTCHNLLIVMTLGGLWHGAAWNFVVWGAMQGLLLVGHKAFAQWRASRPIITAGLRSAARTVLCIGATFTTAVLSFVVFRATTIHDIGSLYARLFCIHGGRPAPIPPVYFWANCLIVVLAHALGTILARRRVTVYRWVDLVPSPALGFGAAAVLNVAMLLGPVHSKAFIYFQF